MTAKFRIPALSDNPNSDEFASFLIATKRVVESVEQSLDGLTESTPAKQKNHQIISTGQFRPKPSESLQHLAINNGAHALLPPTTSCQLALVYVNGVSAGTITTSEFTHVDGTPNTTAGNKWLARITVVLTHSHLEWIALQ